MKFISIFLLQFFLLSITTSIKDRALKDDIAPNPITPQNAPPSNFLFHYMFLYFKIFNAFRISIIKFI